MPDEQAELVAVFAGVSRVIWNSDCHTLPFGGQEDQQRRGPADVDPRRSSTNEPCWSAARAASPVAADTDASDDSDYLDYKYSR